MIKDAKMLCLWHCCQRGRNRKKLIKTDKELMNFFIIKYDEVEEKREKQKDDQKKIEKKLQQLRRRSKEINQDDKIRGSKREKIKGDSVSTKRE